MVASVNNIGCVWEDGTVGGEGPVEGCWSLAGVSILKLDPVYEGMGRECGVVDGGA